MQVHIKNPQLFNEKKQAIKSAGKDACYVISDFDRTLTYGTFNGKKRPVLFLFWGMGIILHRIMLLKLISFLIIIML